jgi:hypothetical protein
MADRPLGLGDLVGRLVREAHGLVSDFAELAVLDARRAAVRLAILLAAGLGAAVLIVTAWMALVGALTVWLWGEGLGWPAALSIGAGINVAAAVVIVLWMKRAAKELPFTALLRQLRGEPPPGKAERPHSVQVPTGRPDVVRSEPAHG